MYIEADACTQKQENRMAEGPGPKMHRNYDQHRVARGSAGLCVCFTGRRSDIGSDIYRHSDAPNHNPPGGDRVNITVGGVQRECYPRRWA